MVDQRQGLLQRALDFVEHEGSDLERLRAAVLAGRRSPDDLVEALCAKEDPPTDPNVAARALHLLAEHRLLHHPEVPALTARLEELQEADGGWSPFVGASEEERLLHTGLVAGALARAPCARPGCLHRAAAFLADLWSLERVQGPSLGPILAYAPLFSLWPHDLSDSILHSCGRELEHGYREARFDPLATARIFSRCEARALPGAKVAADELSTALLATQSTDGGFEAGGAPERRCEATLDAVLALSRLCS